MQTSKLIFVYNANSGVVNSLLDAAHKLISPTSYKCDLCTLTFGAATVKAEWKNFVKDLPVSTEFLHIDEFNKKYPSLIGKYEFPIVLMQKEENYQVFITSQEFSGYQDLGALMKAVQEKLGRSK